MADHLATQVDKPYGQQPATRAAARRVVEREPDAAELIETLGLGDQPAARRHLCPTCGRVNPRSGRCRSTLECRRAVDGETNG